MDGQDGRKRMTIAKREKVQGNGGKADKTYKDGTGAPTASPSANLNLLARMTQSGGWSKCQHLDAGRQSLGSWWELQWMPGMGGLQRSSRHAEVAAGEGSPRFSPYNTSRCSHALYTV